MSTATINVVSAKTLINQGFSHSTNPSGIVLNRRGRLARTLVVLSLAIVLLATFGFSAGAGIFGVRNLETVFVGTSLDLSLPRDLLFCEKFFHSCNCFAHDIFIVD